MCVKASEPPVVPMMNAGKMCDQYLSGESASARRTVAIMSRPCATRRMYFGLNLSESGPLKLVASEKAPRGSLVCGSAG